MLALLTAWLFVPLAAARPQAPDPAAGARALAEVVRGYVDQGRVPGAVLMVVARGETVLHEAYGLADLESGAPMEPDTPFNLRSMTKPLLGTLAQSLADEGLFALEAPVARYLPEFERGLAAEITLEHLLGHRSGLAWNLCTEGDSLSELVACSARVGPREFVPGTSFEYSNAGSNVLALAAEQAGGAPLEELLEQRVLRPLGMARTFALHHPDDPRRAGMPARYVRLAEGGFQRTWGPGDGPPLRFLQGAQGLAGPAEDYARLLQAWMRAAAGDGSGPLSVAAARRALRPAALTALPTTFPGRRVYYGQHWELWSRGDGGRVEGFGHGGSDGTFAWAFPERELAVLYLTQAVDTTTGLELEATIERCLLRGEASEAPAAFAPYVGVYWGAEAGLPRTVYVDAAGALCVDVAGTGGFTLEPTEDPARWTVVGRPGFDVRFDLDERGRARALLPPERTGEAPAPRAEPDPDLPSVDALMARRFRGEETDSLGRLGVFRMAGALELSGGQTGTDVLWSDGELRSREELRLGERGPEATSCDGERVVVVSPRGRRRELSGAERDTILAGRLSVVAGDWRRHYERLEVVARAAEPDGRATVVVVARRGEAPPLTCVVDEETGLALRVLSSVPSPFGPMARITELEDYREVEGLRLPFRWRVRYAAESFGTVTVQYESIELRVEPPPGTFALGG